jgi:GNAT superfamily N-acetyltransferase
MNLTFERATAADAAALVVVQIAAFHHDAVLYPGVQIGGPPGYDSLEDMHRKMAEGQCYKMVDAGRIIGGIVVFDMGEGRVHVGLIFMDPAYHNRGIGTRAMQFLEQTYPAAILWTLDTPTWAIRNQHFYEKLGYTKVGEEVLPDITLIQYEKRVG